MQTELKKIQKNDWDTLYTLIYEAARDCRLPLLLPPVIYNSYQRWPLWMFAESELLPNIKYIKLDQIVGDNWANNQDRKSYPKIGKLTSVLSGMLWRMPASGNKTFRLYR